MNTSDRKDARLYQTTDEVRGRAGERVTTRTSSPGGAGARERIPAKGNDITREDDSLMRDIEDEVNNALERGQRNVPDTRH